MKHPKHFLTFGEAFNHARQTGREFTAQIGSRLYQVLPATKATNHAVVCAQLKKEGRQ